MSDDNLKLWELVEKTDPKHTKKANVKGNKLTSIKPQYQIYNATKQWGSYGSKWGFKDINFCYELKDVGLVTFKALFYYPNGEFPIVNTISFWRDGAQTKIDDEFAKKVETDSLTKALSKLGFNADVFMGRFDDLRYVEDVKKEFSEPKNDNEEKRLEDLRIELIGCANLKELQEVYSVLSSSDKTYFKDKKDELKTKLK